MCPSCGARLGSDRWHCDACGWRKSSGRALLFVLLPAAGLLTNAIKAFVADLETLSAELAGETVVTHQGIGVQFRPGHEAVTNALDLGQRLSVDTGADEVKMIVLSDFEGSPIRSLWSARLFDVAGHLASHLSVGDIAGTPEIADLSGSTGSALGSFKLAGLTTDVPLVRFEKPTTITSDFFQARVARSQGLLERVEHEFGPFREVEAEEDPFAESWRVEELEPLAGHAAMEPATEGQSARAPNEASSERQQQPVRAGADGGQGYGGDVSGGGGGGSSDTGGTAQPSPPIVTRVLRGEFPKQVHVGETLTLIATISEQSAHPGQSAPLSAVAVGSAVSLVCSAPGFDLRSDMQVTVIVPHSGDSVPAPFTLVATDLGLKTITVRAFVGSSYLGVLPIRVTVDSLGPTERPTQHSAKISRRGWQPGEVTLEIEYDADAKLYAYRWRDGTFAPDVSFRSEGQLQRTPSDIIDGIVKGLNELARGKKGYSQRSAEDWLVNQGVGLWRSFFPQSLQVQFRENWGNISRLSIISKNDMIPWELLYASDEEGELGYLAARFPISRLPAHGVPSDLSLPTADFVRPLQRSPAKAEKEVNEITDILSGRGVDTHTALSDLDSLRGLLDAKSFSLLHFASHNSFARTEPFARIRLGESAFEPSFLNKYEPRSEFASLAPLVFINACGSDARTPVYTRLGGWADSFLNAGAGAFIGSLWEVRDTSSRTFATEFYSALAADKTIGESISAARAKLRSNDPSDPTWLAYTLWGDPAATVRLGGGA